MARSGIILNFVLEFPGALRIESAVDRCFPPGKGSRVVRREAGWRSLGCGPGESRYKLFVWGRGLTLRKPHVISRFINHKENNQ